MEELKWGNLLFLMIEQIIFQTIQMKNVLYQTGNLIHYAKEKEKINVMIAVFMRIMRITILHTNVCLKLRILGKREL